MNRKRVSGWLLLALTAACSLPLALGLGARCAELFMGWCDLQPRVALVLIGLALLPVLGSLLLGMRAGVAQLWRTARVLGPLRAAITPALPPVLRDLHRQLGLTNRLDLLETSVPFACCYGLIRPRIGITTGLLALLTPDEVAAVLRHECAHLQRRDPLRTWLWTVCDGMCWWAPRLSEEVRIRHELAADQAVIMVGGRQALACAVLKLIEYPQARLSGLTADLAISRLSAIEARIDQLLQPDQAVSLAPLALSNRLAPLIGLVILAVCLMTMAGMAV